MIDVSSSSAGQVSNDNAVAASTIAPPSVGSPPQTAAPARQTPHAPANVPPRAVLLSEAVQRAIEAPPAGSPAAKRRASVTQVVDPRVSRAKFEQQVKWFRDYEDVQRRRGFLLIEAAFPRVVLAVCVPHVRPHAILFGVVIDYTNWDLEPPSLRVVDPFTLRPLLAKELVSAMKRQMLRGPAAPLNETADTPLSGDLAPTPASRTMTPLGEDVAVPMQPTCANSPIPAEKPTETPPATSAGQGAAPPLCPPEMCMLQFGLPDEVPFLCLAGVREYHEHPAHTGDSWWVHRTTGAGSLSHLLNV